MTSQMKWVIVSQNVAKYDIVLDLMKFCKYWKATYNSLDNTILLLTSL